MVLRAHLLVEAHLNALLDEFIGPELTELQRLSFGQKVDLAIAFGWLGLSDRPALLTINRLRNRFAHDLKAKISSAAANSLKGQLSETMTTPVQKLYRLQDLPAERFSWCALAIVMRVRGVVLVREQLKTEAAPWVVPHLDALLAMERSQRLRSDDAVTVDEPE